MGQSNTVFTPVLAMAAVVVTGCVQQDHAESSAEPTLRIVIHDAPADEVEEVWVQFDAVEVHGEGGWVTISSSLQSVELLSLQNGVVQELGLTSLAAGHYDQIRLHVADSWVVVDGSEEPLDVPSGHTSGLKIGHGFELPECGELTLSLDWDVGAQLVYGSGFKLRPVLDVAESLDTSGCGGGPDTSVFSADFDTSFDAAPTGVSPTFGQNPPTLVNGEASFPQSTATGLFYALPAPLALGDTGAIHFDMRPAATQPQYHNMPLFHIANSTSDLGNMVGLLWSRDNSIRIDVLDSPVSANMLGTTTTVGFWTPVVGQQYSFALEWDFAVQNVVKVFIDGVEFGSAPLVNAGNGRTDAIQYVAPASQHSGRSTQTPVQSLDNIKLYETPLLF